MKRHIFHVDYLTPVENGGSGGSEATVNSSVVDVGERVGRCHSLANQKSSFPMMTSLGFTAAASSILHELQHGFSGLLLVPVVIYTKPTPVMNDQSFLFVISFLSLFLLLMNATICDNGRRFGYSVGLECFITRRRENL